MKIQRLSVRYRSQHLAPGTDSAGLVGADFPWLLCMICMHRECSIQPTVVLCCCFPGILPQERQREKQNKYPTGQLKNWLIELKFEIDYSNAWLPDYCIFYIFMQIMQIIAAINNSFKEKTMEWSDRTGYCLAYVRHIKWSLAGVGKSFNPCKHTHTHTPKKKKRKKCLKGNKHSRKKKICIQDGVLGTGLQHWWKECRWKEARTIFCIAVLIIRQGS